MDRETVRQLEERARGLREIALKMAHRSGSEGAHIGPAFSIMDVMAALYFEVMNYRVEQPDWELRDRLVLSKGHACLGLYAPLVMSGLMSEAEADTFNQAQTRIAGHPSGKGVAGIEHPAGSLGHGLGVGCGMAKAAKMNGQGYDVYVVIGDGEANEGSVWEAAMFATQHGLDNLTVIVDMNGFQYGGKTKELMNMEPMAEKWKAFGWSVREADGHDMEQLCDAMDKQRKQPGAPTCVLAHTVKGYGVSLFANNNDWHHGVITDEVLALALNELQQGRAAS